MDPRVATLSEGARGKVIRSRIEIALEQLIRLREGQFNFSLTDEPPKVVGERDITLETLDYGHQPPGAAARPGPGHGRGPARLDGRRRGLVRGAREDARGALDESTRSPGDRGHAGGRGLDARPPDYERRGHDPHAGAPLPPADVAEPRPARPGPSRPSRRPRSGPSCSWTTRRTCAASSPSVPGRGLHRGRRPRTPRRRSRWRAASAEEDVPFLLVTDLGMPTSGGSSFQGGFEVVKRLWKMNLHPPVLMMTESLSRRSSSGPEADGRLVLRLQAGARRSSTRSSSRPTCRPSRKKLAGRRPSQAHEPPAEPPPPAPVAQAGGRLPPPRAAPVAPRSWPADVRCSSAGSPSCGEPGERQPDRDARHEGRARVLRAGDPVPHQERARLAGLGGFGPAPKGQSLNLLAREVVIPLAEPSALPRRGGRAASPIRAVARRQVDEAPHGQDRPLPVELGGPLPARHPPRDASPCSSATTPRPAGTFGRLEALEIFIEPGRGGPRERLPPAQDPGPFQAD